MASSGCQESRVGTSTCTLTADEQRRYARHLVLPEIGEAGQKKLHASHALVIGAGGLGSAALGHLAAAGIGRITLVEHDRVELSNLQRQLLFETADIGRSKAEAARDRLEEINPQCHIETITEKLTDANARELVARCDIVLDGSDNFPTRFAVNAACHAERKPLISAAISGFSAQLSTFRSYEDGPCYRCLVPEVPERAKTCAQEGIIGPLAGLMGSMQALEAIKELLGIGQSLTGSVLIFDALNMDIRKTTLPRDEACPHCHS
jgi:adenylyltransferase/sulfurtransferase